MSITELMKDMQDPEWQAKLRDHLAREEGYMLAEAREQGKRDAVAGIVKLLQDRAALRETHWTEAQLLNDVVDVIEDGSWEEPDDEQ